MATKEWRDAQHGSSPDGWSNDDVSKLKNRYGITPHQYLALLHQQNGRCAVCRQLPETGQRLHVHHLHDHHHEGVKSCCVVALLCPRDNLAEGNVLSVLKHGGWLAVLRLLKMTFVSYKA